MADKEMRTSRDDWEHWDIADEIKTGEGRAAYLNAVIELDDPRLLQTVLGGIAKARGMTVVAEQSSISREILHLVLSGKHDAHFCAIAKIIGSLGLEIRIELKPAEGGNYAIAMR